MAPAPATDWWVPFTQFNDVAVMHVDLAPGETKEQEAWAWLDGEERRRALRFQHTGARRRHVLCRASLRSLLCGALDCRNQQLSLGASEHGKPFATVDGLEAPIAFNVSHSGQHGLIAMAPRGRVGVDVEERAAQRNLDVLIDAVLGPRERAGVMAASGRQRLDVFLDLWTLKEALGKAHGLGLSLDVSSFEIPADIRNGARSGVLRLPGMPEVAWRLANIGTDRFAAAVAHDGEAP